MIELLDPKTNWSKVSSGDGETPLFKTVAPLPQLHAASGIHPMVSQDLTYPTNAFTGKTFNEKRKK